MARLDYSISVTPIQSASLEGQTIEAIEADIGRGLSASKSDCNCCNNRWFMD